MAGFSGPTEPQTSLHNTTTHAEQELKSEITEVEQQQSSTPKSSLWSNILATTFSVFESCSDKFTQERSNRTSSGPSGTSYLSAAVKKAMYSDQMRKIQDRILGTRWSASSSSSNEIWLLGVSYKVTEETSDGLNISQGNEAFLQDFSSRIWFTYRKGFKLIQDTTYDSDSGWGCMLRSGQMLVAQALLFHHLGRSWRKSTNEPFDREYIEILQYFGDEPSGACPFSIHNLLEAGKPYGLVAGEWLGPYALCRSLQALASAEKKRCQSENCKLTLPMAVYVVSGDSFEAGGAPGLCIDDVGKLCSEWVDKKENDQVPLLILVPLVLGVEKINPRYLPSLCKTFTFPQSLGIVGGKPHTSTYIVGVQEDQAIYLDPHAVQQTVEIVPENLEATAETYHCSVVRSMLLSDLDPSLAIGFYCRNREEFDDFCTRAIQLAEDSNGAPLFTVTQSTRSSTVSTSLNIMLEDDTTLHNSADEDWEIV